MTSGAVQHPTGPSGRQLLHEVAAVDADLPRFATAPLLRRWHRHWGATPAEASAGMPADDLVSRAQYWCTCAVTIIAPPGQVWPWLVQVGWLRAGFYADDLVDNLGHPRSRTILPEFQHAKAASGFRWLPPPQR
jgi:hypothetical protein